MLDKKRCGAKYGAKKESLSFGSWLQTLIISTLLGCVVYLLYTTAHHYFGKRFWPIVHVAVEGNYQHAHLESLETILKQSAKGDLLRLSLTSMGDAIGAIPWVDTVQLSRRMPDTLLVRIQEKKPVARWNQQSYLDAGGDEFSGVVYTKKALIVNLWGPEGEQQDVLDHYLVFQKLLAPLSLKISELRLSQRLSWQLTTDAGMQLILGQKETVDKISRFVSAYPYLIKNNQNNAIKRVDLRYPHGLAIGFFKKRL